MVSKVDLQKMEVAIMKNTKAQISEAIDPLKSEIFDLKERVQNAEEKWSSDALSLELRMGKIEKNPSTSSQADTKTSLSPDIKNMIDNLDPAHNRITFSGFPVSMAQAERKKMIEEFFAGFQKLPKVSNIGLILKGPKNNRQATKLSYAEFYSRDDVSEVMKITKDSSFKIGDVSISPKKGLTKINGARNWALREAEKLIKEFMGGSQDDIKIDWKKRTIEKGTTPLFDQQPSDLKGTFLGACSSLTLP